MSVVSDFDLAAVRELKRVLADMLADVEMVEHANRHDYTVVPEFISKMWPKAKRIKSLLDMLGKRGC